MGCFASRKLALNEKVVSNGGTIFDVAADASIKLVLP